MFSRLLQRWKTGGQPEASFAGKFPFFDVLEAVISQTTDINNVTFLQIGAADGVTDDPINKLIRRYNWSGTLVEPSERSLRRLTEHYSDLSNLRFEQCIVTDKDDVRSMVLYEIVDEVCDITHWAEQSASTNRETVEGFLSYFSRTEAGRNLTGDLGKLIRDVTVPAYNFRDLLNLLGMDHLDVMVIDTMGLDARLLATFPFDLMKPKVIMFEHSLLDTDQKLAVLHLLADHGYSFVKFAVDTIAVLDDAPRHWHVTEW